MNLQQASTSEMTVLFLYDSMNKLVECLSGYDYADRPISLEWDGQRKEIKTILFRWRTPEGKGFKVESSDNQIFDITYNENDDEWIILQS